MANNLKLKNAKDGEVVTRFPPEASGFIHIGHAKAALINSLLAKQYNGKMILRFDDTNCDKEKHEYEEAILQDLGSLNVSWDIGPTYTSDYFPQMLDYATDMIKKDKAYCDNSDHEFMKQCRFDGVATPCRDNSVEKNLEMWEEMKKGSPEGLKTCLRAKLSVNNANKCLRDPVIYRCNLTPHPRTGDKYKVYPTYDFACPIVDSLEGVTHALRTSEYLDRNDQYKWMIKTLGLRMPSLDDFSRLNMEYTLMSKRKLTQMVEWGKVTGWDDPRMPTVRGMLRKGVDVGALVDFVKVQGMSKVGNVMEWEKIWNFNKKHLDPRVPRYTCVDQFRIPVTLEGFEPEGGVQYEEKPLHKKNPACGNKKVAMTHKMFLEEQDVVLLSDGEEVTLMDWGNAIVKSIEKVDDKPVSVTMTLNLDGDFKSTKQKLTWLADTGKNVPIELCEFDHLIEARSIDKETDLEGIIRERTEYKLEAIAEEAITALKIGDIIQFNRRGFFRLDAINNGVMKFFFIPDGHLKYGHLSAMARWAPPPPTAEARKEANSTAKKPEGEGEGGQSKKDKKKAEKEKKKAEKAAKKAEEGAAAPAATEAAPAEKPAEEKAAAPAAAEKPAATEEKPAEGEEKGESKKAAKKREKEEAKKKAAAEREAAAAAKAAEAAAKLQGKFGKGELVQSKTHRSQEFVKVNAINKDMDGKQVTVRARVHTVRATAKVGFVLLRATPYSIQAVIAEGESIPREAVKWVGQLNPESVVDVTGTIKVPDAPVVSATQSDVELHIEKMFIVSGSPALLPFQYEDCSRRKLEGAERKEAEARGDITTTVSLDSQLNTRWLATRTKAAHGVFNIQARICRYFRRYLESQEFMEIHSPKIISTASEGGANVFKLGYFGKNAYLAQSPQLYKQMALMGDFHRVYEIAPVFRAENSQTYRHLTEFVGLDLEMCINEHYYEVLDVAEELLSHIFSSLNSEARNYIDLVKEQFPFEDMTWQVPEETIKALGMEVIEGESPVTEIKDQGKVRNMQVRSLRLPFSAGVEIVNTKLATLRHLSIAELQTQAGIFVKDEEDRVATLSDMAYTDDMSTTNEKLLGKEVKAKYGTDFFILDKYPSQVRPFYTMPCPVDERFTNSFDMFIRGNEISSGAQRIHEPEVLLKRAESLGVDMDPIKDYVDSFRLGAWPHGGFGLGMERVVMLFLDLKDVRQSSLFPRDPSRTTP